MSGPLGGSPMVGGNDGGPMGGATTLGGSCDDGFWFEGGCPVGGLGVTGGSTGGCAGGIPIGGDGGDTVIVAVAEALLPNPSVTNSRAVYVPGFP